MRPTKTTPAVPVLTALRRDRGGFIVQRAAEEGQHLQGRVDDERLRLVVFTDFESDHIVGQNDIHREPACGGR